MKILLIFLLFFSACGGEYSTQSYITGVHPQSISNLIAWYDSKDTSTLYTDAACSSLVSETGQTIGCWKDKSGNNNHAIASSASDRGTFNVRDGIDIGGTGTNVDTGACYTLTNNPDGRTIVAVLDDVSLSQVVDGRHGFISQDNTGSGAAYVFFLTDNTSFGNHTARLDGTATVYRGQIGLNYSALSNDGGYVGAAEYGNFPIGGPIIVTVRYTTIVPDWTHLGCIENVSGQLRYRGEYKIKEFIMWNGEVGDVDLSAIQEYLRVKWVL